MKTVFNNLILVFNFFFLGLVTVIALRLIFLGHGLSDLTGNYPRLLLPAISFGIAFFRLAYPYRWKYLVAGLAAPKN